MPTRPGRRRLRVPQVVRGKGLLTLLRTPQSSTGGPDSVSGSSSEPEEFQLWLSDMETPPAATTEQGNSERPPPTAASSCLGDGSDGRVGSTWATPLGSRGGASRACPLCSCRGRGSVTRLSASALTAAPRPRPTARATVRGTSACLRSERHRSCCRHLPPGRSSPSATIYQLPAAPLWRGGALLAGNCSLEGEARCREGLMARCIMGMPRVGGNDALMEHCILGVVV